MLTEIVVRAIFAQRKFRKHITTSAYAAIGLIQAREPDCVAQAINR
jgi:hypothetical protein